METAGADRFTFTALDGSQRTDMWLSNREETQIDTDPWGPDTDDDGAREHANIHLGERHWETDPTATDSFPATGIGVEVDYMAGRNPFGVTQNGVSVPAAVERNFRLYDITVDMRPSEELSRNDLEAICKTWTGLPGIPGRVCLQTITPDSFNRYELGLVEDEFHDDSATLHLFYGTLIRNDLPKTPIDLQLDYDDHTPGGIALNNGAPGTEEVTRIPGESGFGVMIAYDKYTTSPSKFHGLQSVTMHELGHALGIGWLDDDPIELAGIGVIDKGMEVYSGDVNGDVLGPDETPETVQIGGKDFVEWSIMTGPRAVRLDRNSRLPVRLGISIEEILTVDFEEVPSTER